MLSIFCLMHLIMCLMMLLRSSCHMNLKMQIQLAIHFCVLYIQEIDMNYAIGLRTQMYAKELEEKMNSVSLQSLIWSITFL